MEKLIENWHYAIIILALVLTFFLKTWEKWLWGIIAVVAGIYAFAVWTR